MPRVLITQQWVLADRLHRAQALVRLWLLLLALLRLWLSPAPLLRLWLLLLALLRPRRLPLRLCAVQMADFLAATNVRQSALAN